MNKLTKQDFEMIKEAIDIYYNNLWERTMEILTSESFSNVSPTEIDKYWQQQEKEIRKWNTLKEKLK